MELRPGQSELAHFGKYIKNINEALNENAEKTAKEIFDELLAVNGEEIATMDKAECMYMLKQIMLKCIFLL